MLDTKSIGSLEIAADDAFERWEWMAQRIGWLLLAGYAVLALLGFTGSGPLNRKAERSPDDAISVTHPRFGRMSQSMQMEMSIVPDNEGTVTVWLSRELMERARVEDVSPEPQTVAAGAGGATYTFSVEHGTQSVHCYFRYKVERPGRLAFQMGRNSRQPFTVSQFILP